MSKIKQHGANSLNAMKSVIPAIAGFLYIVIAAVVLFVPNMNETVLSYIVAALVVILGIVLIVRYFVKRQFEQLTNFGFSAGAFFVIIGAMVFAASGAGAMNYFYILIGIMTLVVGVVMLQQAIQMIIIKRPTWIGVLVAAVLVVVGSILVLIDVGGAVSQGQMEYIVMLVSGVLAIASMIITRVGVKQYENEIGVVDVVDAIEEQTP